MLTLIAHDDTDIETDDEENDRQDDIDEDEDNGDTPAENDDMMGFIIIIIRLL